MRLHVNESCLVKNVNFKQLKKCLYLVLAQKSKVLHFATPSVPKIIEMVGTVTGYTISSAKFLYVMDH